MWTCFLIFLKNVVCWNRTCDPMEVMFISAFPWWLTVAQQKSFNAILHFIEWHCNIYSCRLWIWRLSSLKPSKRYPMLVTFQLVARSVPTRTGCPLVTPNTHWVGIETRSMLLVFTWPIPCSHLLAQAPLWKSGTGIPASWSERSRAMWNPSPTATSTLQAST
jgi:hypothetical protein